MFEQGGHLRVGAGLRLRSVRVLFVLPATLRVQHQPGFPGKARGEASVKLRVTPPTSSVPSGNRADFGRSPNRRPASVENRGLHSCARGCLIDSPNVNLTLIVRVGALAEFISDWRKSPRTTGGPCWHPMRVATNAINTIARLGFIVASRTTGVFILLLSPVALNEYSLAGTMQ